MSTDNSKPDSSQSSNRPTTNRRSSPRAGQPSSGLHAAAIDPAILDPKEADSKSGSAAKASSEIKKEEDSRAASGSDATQALAPPPRPGQSQQNKTDEPDYFSGSHNKSHFLSEPNPFEQSFGQPSGETPGKGLLPPVASLTSPAPLTGAAPSAGGFNWPGSLRSGPLSPAMLGGPVGSNADYFGEGFKGGFPTPNESSLRTGLTPGGGGSMFPAPSPNSQALYNSLAGGGATPSTLEFQRTAMNAAASNKINASGASANAGPSQDSRAPVAPMSQTATTQNQPNSLDQQDAANGLFMLANATQGVQNNQFAVPQQPAAVNASQPQSQETSPQVGRRGGGTHNGSIGSSGQGFSEMSGVSEEEDNKPATRNRGKRAATGKNGGAANGRRKADDSSAKQPAAKKQRTAPQSLSGGDSDEEMNMKEDQYHADGKKMTDEDKRKNFLERNRYV